jgi:hypothetical protein
MSGQYVAQMFVIRLPIDLTSHIPVERKFWPQFCFRDNTAQMVIGRLIVEVYRSHTHTTELLWTSDQLVAEAATYTSHNEYNRRTSKPSDGFESAESANKELQICSLDNTATGVGSQSRKSHNWRVFIPYLLLFFLYLSVVHPLTF